MLPGLVGLVECPLPAAQATVLPASHSVAASTQAVRPASQVRGTSVEGTHSSLVPLHL